MIWILSTGLGNPSEFNLSYEFWLSKKGNRWGKWWSRHTREALGILRVNSAVNVLRVCSVPRHPSTPTGCQFKGGALCTVHRARCTVRGPADSWRCENQSNRIHTWCDTQQFKNRLKHNRYTTVAQQYRWASILSQFSMATHTNDAAICCRQGIELIFWMLLS